MLAFEILLGLVLLRGMGRLITMVGALGRFVPEPSVATDFAVALAVGLLAFVPTFRMRATPAEARVLRWAWGAKLAAALGLALVYEHQYSFLDAYSYQVAAMAPELNLWDSLTAEGTERINAVAWLLHQGLGFGYHANKVVFAFLGFLAVRCFYAAWCTLRGARSWRLLALLMFTPSILWWSSILGKDPIVLLGIGLFVQGTSLLHERRFGEGAWRIVSGFAISISIRAWLGPVLALPLLVLGARYLRRPVIAIPLVIGTALYLQFGFTALAQRFQAATIREFFSTTESIAVNFGTGGSNLEVRQDIGTPSGALRFLPLGAFTALFRPLPGEVNNLFGVLAGLEDLAVLLLCVYALARTRGRALRDPISAWFAAMVVLWTFVYAFISYHNLGTAVRYRLQILPVLLLLMLHLGGLIRYDDEGAPEPELA